MRAAGKLDGHRGKKNAGNRQALWMPADGPGEDGQLGKATESQCALEQPFRCLLAPAYLGTPGALPR